MSRKGREGSLLAAPEGMVVRKHRGIKRKHAIQLIHRAMALLVV